MALKRIKTDIHNCSALITEPKLLTQRVAEIYAQYVREDAVNAHRDNILLKLIFIKLDRRSQYRSRYNERIRSTT